MDHEHRLDVLRKQLDPDVDKFKIHRTKLLNFNKVLIQNKKRAVLVVGYRTPFVKAFGDFAELDAVDLGVQCVNGLLKKTKIDPEIIDQLIWANAVKNSNITNVAEEIILNLKLSTRTTGKTMNKSCLSGLEAFFHAVELIENGNAEVILAGGSESMSSSEVLLPKDVRKSLRNYRYSKTNGISNFIKLMEEIGAPLSCTPKTTGDSTGYHSDLLAEIHHISREDQDIYTLSSYSNATKASKDGIFQEEIIPVELKNGKLISKDEIVMEGSNLRQLKKLRENGPTNSSTFTDGASVILIMSEEKANQLGFDTDIVVDSVSVASVDPNPDLLLAPTISIPKCLKKAKLTLDEIDIIEMHEAFSAQVLSTLSCLNSEGFLKKFLKTTNVVGRISPQMLNVHGGSLALGHPFSATGGRLLISGMNELRRNNKVHCLITACSVGGQGGSCIVTNRNAKK